MGVRDKRQRTQHSWKQLAPIPVLSLILAGLAAAGSTISSVRAFQHVPSGVPVDFEANNNPNSPVKYSARTALYSLFISNEEADLVLHGEATPSNKLRRGKLIVVKAYASLVRMRFVDSNLPTGITPLDARDRSRLPYTSIAYRGIYPGTDVLLRAQQRRIAFQVNLSPGAGTENIVLELAGASRVKLDNVGNAIVNVGRASFVLQKPVVGTRADINQKLVSGSYEIEHGNRLRFIVPRDSSPASQTVGD